MAGVTPPPPVDNGRWLGMPPALYIAFITAFFPTLATCVLGYFTYLNGTKIEKNQAAIDSTKVTVDATKTVVDDTKSSVKASGVKAEKAAIEAKATAKTVKSTADETHSLITSQFLAQLKASAEVARAKADMTNDPADILAAELAEKLYNAHRERRDKAGE